MAVGLYSGVSGLAVGVGLYKGVSGLWGGSSGLINGFGGSGPFPGASLYLDFLTPPLDSRITFSRGSNATLVDSTGKITYAPANLFTNSEFPNGVTDAPTRGGLLTATTFSGLTGTTGLAFGYDGTTSTYAYKAGAVTGTTYVFSVYVRMDDGGAPVFEGASGSSANNTFAIGIGGAVSVPTTYTVVDMGGGLYRVSGAATAGGVPANSGIVKYATNDNRTFKVSGYQLEPVTYQTTPSTYVATTASAYYSPRFDYDPVTLAPRGLLIEEARTNLLTYSEQFDNAAWTKSAATITANAITSPDGTVDADKIEATSISPNVFQDIVVSGTSAVLSVYMKKGSGADSANVLLLRNQTLGTNLVAVRVNLDRGTITYLAGSSGATATDAGNGWWRVVVTASITSGNTIRVGLLGGYSAVAGDFAYYYGAQLEVGAFATSYIPTVASTVSRSADVALMTGTNFSSWFNAAQGTFVASIGSNATSRCVLVASDGSVTNQILMFSTADNVLAVYTGGAYQAQIGVTPTASYVNAGAYATNDFAACSNGRTVATDTSGSLAASYTQMSLGSNYNGNPAKI
jgi:hypothetical protein